MQSQRTLTAAGQLLGLGAAIAGAAANVSQRDRDLPRRFAFAADTHDIATAPQDATANQVSHHTFPH
jgi:hypothetical protein